MKKKKLIQAFDGGPLVDAAKKVEDFGYNLYFSYVFNRSVEQHKQLQDDFIEAFLDQDEIRMQQINKELSIVEAAFEATATMLDITEELSS
jgi:hypothetical protein|tara:strand:- start:165 stop:437 length:273 start_codon:yes stop_codon:yes gene_type:complete